MLPIQFHFLPFSGYGTIDACRVLQIYVSHCCRVFPFPCCHVFFCVISNPFRLNELNSIHLSLEIFSLGIESFLVYHEINQCVRANPFLYAKIKHMDHVPSVKRSLTILFNIIYAVNRSGRRDRVQCANTNVSNAVYLWVSNRREATYLKSWKL